MTYENRHRFYREAMSAAALVAGLIAAILRPQARVPLVIIALVMPVLSLVERGLEMWMRR